MIETTFDTDLGYLAIDSIRNGAVKSRDQLVELITGHDAVSEVFVYVGHTFNNKSLLLNAISHSSFVNEVTNFKTENSERLEFLGDSVLNTSVTTLLMHNFPSFSEGELSKFRGSLVNESSLAGLARSISLGSIILLGKGELASGGRDRDTILADIFEAMIGAIYMDAGFEMAFYVLNKIFKHFENVSGDRFLCVDRLAGFDAKTKLQEETMARYKSLPDYRYKQKGDGSFEVELYIAGDFIAKESDISKKRASKRVAELALTYERFKA